MTDIGHRSIATGRDVDGGSLVDVPGREMKAVTGADSGGLTLPTPRLAGAPSRMASWA
ncbi:hypothetical protein [Actinomadura coerulea]|uniref:hypothetical protein n=1 Tax=Actinomadura coerulea TaxID=46159 RepID=UPI003439B5E4